VRLLIAVIDDSVDYMSKTTAPTPPAEPTVEDWRLAVAGGETELSFTAWLREQKSTSTYVCAKTTVDLYIYVDLTSGVVDSIVIDDDLHLNRDKLTFLFADQNHCTEPWPGTVSDWHQAAAWDIMENSTWPAWNFGW
jgi:hypothetical protein